MSRIIRTCTASLAVSLMLVSWLTGCTSSQPRSTSVTSPPEAPSGQPAVEPDRPVPTPATQPSTGERRGAPQPAPAPAQITPPAPAQITPPAPPSTEPPQQLPDYLQVVARFDRSEPAFVDFEITAPSRLAIETRNVQRLRIERSQLPLRTERSIVLRLDGQGIEWTPKSTTTVFERSPNGAWMPVKEDRP